MLEETRERERKKGLIKTENESHAVHECCWNELFWSTAVSHVRCTFSCEICLVWYINDIHCHIRSVAVWIIFKKIRHSFLFSKIYSRAQSELHYALLFINDANWYPCKIIKIVIIESYFLEIFHYEIILRFY